MKNFARLSAYTLLLSASLFSLTSCNKEDEIKPQQTKVVQESERDASIPPLPLIRR
ncbi:MULTISPECIES: hypothetical protein [Siphonobacter]|uniref:hypothetical protein n=1 Tax=Siphonobacter TaxID=700450 RepID=UPI0013FD2BFE|nr:hypothetical protein [Siphonobacter curvatus]